MKYGILGSGEATEAAVHEALADILKKDKKAEFLIHARRSPQGSVPAVYDFLVDNECSFTSYTKVDDKAPKPLLDLAKDIVRTEDPLRSIINDAEQVLLLWDEKDEQASSRISLMCADEGLSILDLSMALTPIVVDPPSKETTKEEPVKEETAVSEDAQPFTRDELLAMNIGVLRRQAKSMGIEVGVAKKEDIVNMILGVDTTEIASNGSEDITEEQYMAEVTEGQLNWVVGGVLASRELTAEQVRAILKML